MKKLLLLAIAFIGTLSFAVTEDEIFELYKKQIVDKYNADMKTDYGRAKWYGKIEKSIILTNKLRRVDIHSSGAIFTNKWRDAYAVKAKAYKRRTQIPPALTNGVPKKLAEARMKRWREKNTVSNVTIKVTGNAKK